MILLTDGNAGGSFSLPAPDQVTVGRLDDGTRVFVVRHGGGGVSVLPSSTGCLLWKEMQCAARWDPAWRRFLDIGGLGVGEAWDEYGRSVFGANSADLPVFATEVADDAVLVYAPGEPYRDGPIAPLRR